MKEKSCSLEEMKKKAMYSRGDVLETKLDTKAVVQEILLSITHSEIKYRIRWKHSKETVCIPEQSIDSCEIVDKMSRPYTWEDN